MVYKEDLELLFKNPSLLLKGISTLRQKAKFYTHLEEVFLHQSYGWLYKTIKPNTLVLDIGAYIGDTAIYFAMNSNVKSVEAYEPHPKSYELLTSNVRKSSFRNIATHNCAISNMPGTAAMTRSEVTGFNSINRSNGTGVPIVAFSSILIEAYRNFDRIAIKCDVEGEEHKIFSKDVNLDKVYSIQLEYHNGVQQLRSILKEKGFTTEVRQNYLCALRKR